MKTEESLKDILDVLSGDEDEKELEVENPDEVENEEEIEEENEEKNKEEDENIEDEEDEEIEKESKKSNQEIPSFKAINKKYPELFKEFPHLRHAFFHEREYRELFSTVDEAKEAVEILDSYKELEENLALGTEEGTTAALEALKGLGDKIIPSFANNFLSSIRKMDQNLYYEVMSPELVGFTRSMFTAAVRNENDNLKNAALVAAQYFFGDQKIASGEKELKLSGKKSESTEKDTQLEKDRISFRNERYSTLYNDVIQDSDTQLNSLILDGIDPKGTMTSKMKSLAVKDVVDEINKILNLSNIHKKKMDSLWRKAASNNFSSSHKQAIVAAFLDSAKQVMPKIRSKVRAEILGIRDRSSGNKMSGHKDRIEPKHNVSGSSSRQSASKVNLENVNWKKTSDLDFLKDKVTLKK